MLPENRKKVLDKLCKQLLGVAGGGVENESSNPECRQEHGKFRACSHRGDCTPCACRRTRHEIAVIKLSPAPGVQNTACESKISLTLDTPSSCGQALSFS